MNRTISLRTAFGLALALSSAPLSAQEPEPRPIPEAPSERGTVRAERSEIDWTQRILEAAEAGDLEAVLRAYRQAEEAAERRDAREVDAVRRTARRDGERARAEMMERRQQEMAAVEQVRREMARREVEVDRLRAELDRQQAELRTRRSQLDAERAALEAQRAQSGSPPRGGFRFDAPPREDASAELRFEAEEESAAKFRRLFRDLEGTVRGVEIDELVEEVGGLAEVLDDVTVEVEREASARGLFDRLRSLRGVAEIEAGASGDRDENLRIFFSEEGRPARVRWDAAGRLLRSDDEDEDDDDDQDSSQDRVLVIERDGRQSSSPGRQEIRIVERHSSPTEITEQIRIIDGRRARSDEAGPVEVRSGHGVGGSPFPGMQNGMNELRREVREMHDELRELRRLIEALHGERDGRVALRMLDRTRSEGSGSGSGGAHPALVRRRAADSSAPALRSDRRARSGSGSGRMTRTGSGSGTTSIIRQRPAVIRETVPGRLRVDGVRRILPVAPSAPVPPVAPRPIEVREFRFPEPQEVREVVMPEDVIFEAVELDEIAIAEVPVLDDITIVEEPVLEDITIEIEEPLEIQEQEFEFPDLPAVLPVPAPAPAPEVLQERVPEPAQVPAPVAPVQAQTPTVGRLIPLQGASRESDHPFAAFR